MTKLQSPSGVLTSSTNETVPSASVSIAEAARLLNMSTPYVVMLCDAGKLGSPEVTPDGQKRIAQHVLERYQQQTLIQYADAPTPQQAGIEAGLYDYEDSHFTNVSRK